MKSFLLSDTLTVSGWQGAIQAGLMLQDLNPSSLSPVTQASVQAQIEAARTFSQNQDHHQTAAEKLPTNVFLPAIKHPDLTQQFSPDGSISTENSAKRFDLSKPSGSFQHDNHQLTQGTSAGLHDHGLTKLLKQFIQSSYSIATDQTILVTQIIAAHTNLQSDMNQMLEQKKYTPESIKQQYLFLVSLIQNLEPLSFTAVNTTSIITTIVDELRAIQIKLMRLLPTNVMATLYPGLTHDGFTHHIQQQSQSLRLQKSETLQQLIALIKLTEKIKALESHVRELQKRSLELRQKARDLEKQGSQFSTDVANLRAESKTLLEMAGTTRTKLAELRLEELRAFREPVQNFSRIVEQELNLARQLTKQAFEYRKEGNLIAYYKYLNLAGTVFYDSIREDSAVLDSIVETRLVLDSKTGSTKEISRSLADKLGQRISRILKLHQKRMQHLGINEFMSDAFSSSRAESGIPVSVPYVLPIGHAFGENAKKFDKEINRAGLISIYMPDWGTDSVRGTRVLIPGNFLTAAAEHTNTLMSVKPGGTAINSTALSGINSAERFGKKSGQWKRLPILFDWPFHGFGTHDDRLRDKSTMLSWTNGSLRLIKLQLELALEKTFRVVTNSRSLGGNVDGDSSFLAYDLYDSIVIASPPVPQSMDYRQRVLDIATPIEDPKQLEEIADRQYLLNVLGMAWFNGDTVDMNGIPNGLRWQFEMMFPPSENREKFTPTLVLVGAFDYNYPKDVREFKHEKTYPNLPFPQPWVELEKRTGKDDKLVVIVHPGGHFPLNHTDGRVLKRIDQLINHHLDSPENTRPFYSMPYRDQDTDPWSRSIEHEFQNLILTRQTILDRHSARVIPENQNPRIYWDAMFERFNNLKKRLSFDDYLNELDEKHQQKLIDEVQNHLELVHNSEINVLKTLLADENDQIELLFSQLSDPTDIEAHIQKMFVALNITENARAQGLIRLALMEWQSTQISVANQSFSTIAARIFDEDLNHIKQLAAEIYRDWIYMFAEFD